MSMFLSQALFQVINNKLKQDVGIAGTPYIFRSIQELLGAKVDDGCGGEFLYDDLGGQV